MYRLLKKSYFRSLFHPLLKCTIVKVSTDYNIRTLSPITIFIHHWSLLLIHYISRNQSINIIQLESAFNLNKLYLIYQDKILPVRLNCHETFSWHQILKMLSNINYYIICIIGSPKTIETIRNALRWLVNYNQTYAIG